MSHNRSCSIGSLLRSLFNCTSSEDAERSNSDEFRPYGRGGAARKTPRRAEQNEPARTTKEPEAVVIRAYGRGGAARKQPKGVAKATCVDLLEGSESPAEEPTGELDSCQGASIKESAKPGHGADVPLHPVMPMRAYVSNYIAETTHLSELSSRNRIQMILRLFPGHHHLVRLPRRIPVVLICITLRSIRTSTADTTRIPLPIRMATTLRMVHPWLGRTEVFLK